MAKPVLVNAGWNEQGQYEVQLDSGLHVPAEVTWYSDIDGDLKTDGNVTALPLSPGVHTITYEAWILGDEDLEKIIVSLSTVVAVE